MTALPAIPDVQDMLPAIRAAAGREREIYEAGRLAFVSFIRAYREHQVRRERKSEREREREREREAKRGVKRYRLFHIIKSDRSSLIPFPFLPFTLFFSSLILSFFLSPFFLSLYPSITLPSSSPFLLPPLFPLPSLPSLAPSYVRSVPSSSELKTSTLDSK